jgi:hypothetical protein
VALNNLGPGFVLTAHDVVSAKMQGLERNLMSLVRKVGSGPIASLGPFASSGSGSRS